TSNKLSDKNNESDDNSDDIEDKTGSNESFQEKLRQWALKNLNSLQLNVIAELLLLLRQEGHPELPKTTQALLKTKKHCVDQSILSLKGSYCDYKYLGIVNNLKKIIIPTIFIEDTIDVLIHIDGMQIYNNSQVQVWPICVKIINKKYISRPFIAAIYCGDSKPADVSEYLSDFVDECKNLIQSARTYIKCCKAAGTFYACERCTTEGVSVGEEKKKKRVYPEMDCELRSKQSFEKKNQAEHHKDNLTSPLVKLPGFDPVNHIVLDSMHLLFQGVMKSLMECWILRKSHVPFEFQRKTFDSNDLARWKATQFRFVLLYCGPVMFKDILSPQLYDHFLLLFVACRILHYDVINLNLPLSDCSAFWGENFIGKIKNLVKSPFKPLTQIVNRLSE
ncbi:GSCOCG00011425001-RA-CDS, partial [Cotesia congregata]